MNSSTAPLRVAFVMEQVLGHATHYRNMREFASRQPDIAPEWLPISFEVKGASRLVPLLRSNWSVRASLRARRALSSVRKPLDAVLFHTQVTSLFSVGLMRRVPSIISMDATPANYDRLAAHYGHRPANGGLLDQQKYAQNRRALHAAAGLITWSQWARGSLIEDYGVEASHIRVINPGAGAMFFDLGRARVTRQSPITSRRVRLLFVGGDFERKGGPELLEVMAGPLGEISELHLVTSAQVEPRPNVFVHHGLHPNSAELQALFRDADIFVMPTRAECLGVALMEAAAAALPVVTTGDGAQGETVEDGASGLLVPAGDVAALHTALHNLALDVEKRRRMGSAGLALAERRFSAERNNRAVLDFAAELVHARRTARRTA
jgi:glycosyltransferase involved in cell wall biosynthesis